MADFHQTGVISTLPMLGAGDLARLEAELHEHASTRPMALILPCLFSELDGPALEPMIEQLRGARYLTDIIVSVDGAETPEQFDQMQQAFAPLRTIDDQPPTVVWNDGPAMQKMIGRLEDEGLPIGPRGKGRGVWLAMGVALSRDRTRVMAVHDCDIVDYSRELLARLCYPIASGNTNYEFAKGYYARASDRLYGRVTRLFMTPCLRSMTALVGPNPLLEFLDSFRYALAGEVAMTSDLARTIRIPSDWGLEVGMLTEVYRSCSLKRICQVELTENYDHKHRELSPDDAAAGLHRMVADIALALLRNLASFGVSFDPGFLDTLSVAYLRMAQDAIARYHDTATLNGIGFDRHEEELEVEVFQRALVAAGREFLTDPTGAPQIPNWNRVTAALPGFQADLLTAVGGDAVSADPGG